MTLGDVVAGSGLSLFPIIALIIFFVVFVGIAVYVALRRREAWDRMSRLPLEDDPPPASLPRNPRAGEPAQENGR